MDELFRHLEKARGKMAAIISGTPSRCDTPRAESLKMLKNSI